MKELTERQRDQAIADSIRLTRQLQANGDPLGAERAKLPLDGKWVSHAFVGEPRILILGPQALEAHLHLKPLYWHEGDDFGADAAAPAFHTDLD